LLSVLRSLVKLRQGRSLTESGICFHDNSSVISCSIDGINTPSSDPLMLVDFAKSVNSSAIPSGLLILSMVLSGTVLLLQLFLCLPLCFNWRLARTLHLSAIACAGATCFFLFVTSLNATSAISAAMAAIPTVTLQVVEMNRGTLMEAFLWCACAIWFLAFIFGVCCGGGRYWRDVN